MTALSAARRTIRVPRDEIAPPPSGRRLFVGLFLLSLMLLLGRFEGWLTQTVRVVSPPVDGVLSPAGAWSVPLGRFVDRSAVAEWPVWLFAIAGGAAIAQVSLRMVGSSGIVVGLLAMAGWSVVLLPRDLLSGLLVLALIGIAEWRTPNHWWKCGAFAAWLLLCVLVSLEFGCLWLCAGLLVLPEMWNSAPLRQRQRIVGTVAILTGGIVGGGVLFSQGFLGALLRPMNWLWMNPVPELLPSLGFALTTPDGWPSHLLLFVVCWGRLIAPSKSSFWTTMGVIALTCLGLGCGRFLWLTSLALVALLPCPVMPVLAKRRDQTLVVGCLLLALVRLLANPANAIQEVLGLDQPPRAVNPAEWSLTGPVMLTNLDQSDDWQSSALRSQHRLLLNDRWDVFGKLYPHYATVCRDVAELQTDSYLRTDGQWGGSERWMRQWSPSLLVVESSALEDIRRLSLSPQWKILGLDGQRAIYGREADPQTQAARKRAAATLSRLEWPGLSGTPLDPNVIVVHTADEHRRAAAALVAMRLPSAALRVLRTGQTAADLELEALCYLELAHRTHRYAGTVSLLDQVRTVNRVRALDRAPVVRPSTYLRLAFGLRELNLDGLSRVTAVEMLRSKSVLWTTPDQRQQAAVFIDQAASPITEDALRSDQPGATEAERTLRLALGRGNVGECLLLLERIDPTTRPYYSALISAAAAPAAQTLSALRAVLERPDFPVRLQGEAWFYVGCLAMEVGDPPTASTAFTRSAEIAPASPFAPLRNLYLRLIVGS